MDVGRRTWDDSTRILNDEDVKAQKESIQRLADYLGKAVAGGREIELYACWEGEQSEPVLDTLSITPGDLRKDVFQFEERIFLLVSED